MANDVTITRRNSTPQKLKQSQIDKIKVKFGKLSAKQQAIKSDLSKIISSIFASYKKNDFRNDSKLDLLKQYLLLKNITDKNLGFVNMFVDKKEVIINFINSTIDKLLNDEIINGSISKTIKETLTPSAVKTDINKILNDLIDEYVKQNKDLVKSQNIEPVDVKNDKKTTEKHQKSEYNKDKDKEVIDSGNNEQKAEESETDDSKEKEETKPDVDKSDDKYEDKLIEKQRKKHKLAIIANNKITNSILNTAISMFRTQQMNIMYTVDSITKKPIVSKLKKVITESDIIKKIPKITKSSDNTKKLSDVVSHSILLHARLLKRGKYRLTKRIKTLTDSLIYKNVKSGRKTFFSKTLGAASSLLSVGSFIVGGVFGIGKFFVSSTLKLASGLLKFTASIISKTWKHIAKPIIKRLVDIFMNPVGARMLGMLSAVVVIGFQKQFSKILDMKDLYDSFKISIGDFYTNVRLFFRNIHWEKLAKRFNKLTSNINGNRIMDWLKDTLISLSPENIKKFFIGYATSKTITTTLSFLPLSTKVKALSAIAFNPWVLSAVGVGIAAYSIFSAIKEYNENRKKKKQSEEQRRKENAQGITSYKQGQKIYDANAIFNMGRQSRSVLTFSNDFISRAKSFKGKTQRSKEEELQYRIVEASEKSRESRDKKVEQEKISRYIKEQESNLKKEFDKLTNSDKKSYTKHIDRISEIPIKYKQGGKINTTNDLTVLGIEPKDYLKFRTMYALTNMQLLERLSLQEITIDEYENQLASLYDAEQENKLNPKIISDNSVKFLKPTEKNSQSERISASEVFNGDVQHIQSIVRATSSNQKQNIGKNNEKLTASTVSTFTKSGGWHRECLCFKLFMSRGKPIEYNAFLFPPVFPQSSDSFLLEIFRNEDVQKSINAAISNIPNSEEFHNKFKVFVNMMFHDNKFKGEFEELVSSWLKSINNYEIIILKDSWGNGRIKDSTVSYIDMNQQASQGVYYTDKNKLYKTAEYMGSLLNTKYVGYNKPKDEIIKYSKFTSNPYITSNDYLVYYASGDCESSFNPNKSPIRYGGTPQDFTINKKIKNGKLSDNFYVKDNDNITNGCKIYIRLSKKSHIQYKFYDYNKKKKGVISEYKIVPTPDAPPIVQQFTEFILPYIKIFLSQFKESSIDGNNYNLSNSVYTQSGWLQSLDKFERGFQKLKASSNDFFEESQKKVENTQMEMSQTLTKIKKNIQDIKEHFNNPNSDLNKAYKYSNETYENSFNRSISDTNIKVFETEPKPTTDDYSNTARSRRR